MKWIGAVLRWTRVTFAVMAAVAVTFFALVRVSLTARAAGEIEIGTYQKVRPAVGGIITRVHVHSGEDVAPGAMLLELHDTQRELEAETGARDLIEARIALDAAIRERDALASRIHPLERSSRAGTAEQARLDVSRAAARVEECRSIASVAQSRAARVAELHAQGVTSRADLDQAGESARQSEWQLRQAELEHRKIAVAAGSATEDTQLVARQQDQALTAADRQIEQLRARVATLERTIAVATRNERMESVRAAMTGVVVGCDPRELGGRRVEAGEVIFAVVDPTAIRFRALVPEEEVARVKPGQEATIELAGLPRTKFRTFRGRVESVEREAQRTAPGQPGAYAVRIALEQPWVATEHGRLYFPIGMRGTARIVSRPRLGIAEAIVEWVTG